jgi:uncharacterized protein (TIGR02246 family)
MEIERQKLEAAKLRTQIESGESKYADVTPIDKVRDEFLAGFNARDAARISATYTADAVLMPPNQGTVTGRDAIKAFNKNLFESYSAKIAFAPAETKIFGDRALDRGTYMIELTEKAGGGRSKEEGKYLVLLQRQADGSWKVTHDIDNTNGPAAAP